MTLSLAAAAYAKVNLALVVRSRTADGFHPLLGLFQSVSLADTVRLTSANEDGVTVSNDEAPSDTSNVAWTAVERIRGLARMPAPIHLEISKRIPSGAGLGGGSADAAAVVGLLGERFGVERENREEIAASLGSDVPFALVGGTATVRGRGEILEPREPLRGFGLAVVVPPFALSTPEVFARWDELGGPEGETVPSSVLPPLLRDGEPLRNDLLPAARSVEPRLGDWIADLQSDWSTTVCMTGSGSALFGYFPTRDEAAAAAASISVPARLAMGVEPVDTGWHRLEG